MAFTIVVFCFLVLVSSPSFVYSTQTPVAPTQHGSPHILYAVTYSAHLPPGGSYVPITGLNLTLPRLSPHTSGNAALVTLAISAPYSHGDNFPGAQFTIGYAESPTTKIPDDRAWGSFTYANRNPYAEGLSSYRAPVTLQVVIPLTHSPQNIVGVWTTVRGSEAFIDSLASLSAIIF